MSTLPERMIRYLVEVLLAERQPALLEVDDSGRLLSSGGSLVHHGLSELQHGMQVEDQLSYLMGFLPSPEERVVLSNLQTGSGACIDVHILHDSQETSTWVIVLDARSEHEHKQVMQQKGNELSLKTEKQARVLNAHLGKSVVQMLLEGSWPIRSSGERRNATILFSDIRDFTPFSERSTPESVFRTLNQYIPAMLDPIQEHSGIVDKIAGDAVMAVFGILNAVDASPKLAVSTATAILRNVAEVNRLRTAEGQPCLEVGIGIATGPVAVGLIGTFERRGFSAIGHHVNFASRLQGQARPGEILLDEESHRLLEQDGVRFNERMLQLKGFSNPVRAFGLFPLLSDAPPDSERRTDPHGS